MPRTSTDLTLRRFEPATAPTGPPVLLIHGFASDGRSDWITTGWPEALTSAGRVALVPDLPGHGASYAPRDRRGALTSTLVAALAGVVDAEPSVSVDVVGYSLGARLAWELPRVLDVEVAHLVLGGISPVEPFGAVDLSQVLEFTESGRVPSDPLTATIAHMISAPGRDPRALVTCIDGLRTEPFDPRPGDITVPTLFVAGEDDAMADGVDRLVSMVDGASLTHVPGEHTAALRSAQFRRAATTFIARERS